MTRQILVPLSRSDRVEQFIPYLDEVVRPGMTVVFLVHYGTGDLRAILDQSLAIHSGIRPDLSSTDGLGANVEGIAQQEIVSACKPLLRKDVKIEVDIYAGRLRTVMQNHAKKGNVHLVMMHPGGHWLIRFLRKLNPFFQMIGLQNPPAVLIVHPNEMTQKT